MRGFRIFRALRIIGKCTSRHLLSMRWIQFFELKKNKNYSIVLLLQPVPLKMTTDQGKNEYQDQSVESGIVPTTEIGLVCFHAVK